MTLCIYINYNKLINSNTIPWSIHCEIHQVMQKLHTLQKHNRYTTLIQHSCSNEMSYHFQYIHLLTMIMTLQSLQHTATYIQQKHAYNHTYTTFTYESSEATSYSMWHSHTSQNTQYKKPHSKIQNTVSFNPKFTRNKHIDRQKIQN